MTFKKSLFGVLAAAALVVASILVVKNGKNSSSSKRPTATAASVVVRESPRQTTNHAPSPMSETTSIQVARIDIEELPEISRAPMKLLERLEVQANEAGDEILAERVVEERKRLLAATEGVIGK